MHWGLVWPNKTFSVIMKRQGGLLNHMLLLLLLLLLLVGTGAEGASGPADCSVQELPHKHTG
jgi:hypothetical protein